MKQKKWIRAPLILIVVLVFVVTAVANLEQGKQDRVIRQLELVLQRTAVACYAVEGAYPPNVAYMQQHYGLTYDESRYVVHYELFASNFMPEITVMEKRHEE